MGGLFDRVEALMAVRSTDHVPLLLQSTDNHNVPNGTVCVCVCRGVRVGEDAVLVRMRCWIGAFLPLRSADRQPSPFP